MRGASRGTSLVHHGEHVAHGVEQDAELVCRRRQLVGMVVARVAEGGPGVVDPGREGCVRQVAAQADELRAGGAGVEGDAAAGPVGVETLLQGLAAEERGGAGPEAGGLGVGSLEEGAGEGEEGARSFGAKVSCRPSG